MNIFKKFIHPNSLLFWGFALLLFGLLYDILFAGIPPQDPPPFVATRFVFHSAIASFFEKTGVVLFFIGIIGKLFLKIVQLLKKTSK